MGDIWIYDLCIPAVAMTMYSEASVSGKSWPCLSLMHSLLDSELIECVLWPSPGEMCGG